MCEEREKSMSVGDFQLDAKVGRWRDEAQISETSVKLTLCSTKFKLI